MESLDYEAFDSAAPCSSESASGAAGWLGRLMMMNPLSYGILALRQALYLGGPDEIHEFASLPVCLFVSTAFAIAMFCVSAFV